MKNKLTSIEQFQKNLITAIEQYYSVSISDRITRALKNKRKLSTSSVKRCKVY